MSARRILAAALIALGLAATGTAVTAAVAGTTGGGVNASAPHTWYHG